MTPFFAIFKKGDEKDLANTRDVLGDQETLDGLIGKTLTEFEEDGATTVINGALKR